jgi:2-hydroxychromene-2-carboxylate isomerase
MPALSPLEAAPAAAGTAQIDFYFDFASPYAYFAHGRLGALAQRHGLILRRRPILLWALLKELGLPPPLAHADKRRYLEFDMHRCAAFYGLPFRLPADFPAPSGLAAGRLFHTLQAQPPPEWPRLEGALTDAIFRAGFAEGRDISDLGTLGDLAASLGLDAVPAVQAAAAEAGKAGLRLATGEAARRGVWGSPFWFWQGEPYFGADRLPLFEYRLQSGAAAAP